MKAASSPKPQPKSSEEEKQLEFLLPLAVWVFSGIAALFFVGKGIGGMDNDRSAQHVELVLALGAAGIIWWGMNLARAGRATAFQAARDKTLVAIGFACMFAFTNFGRGHFGNFIHTWDTYHYYMGAKYFNELSYDRLYDCAMIADAEDGFRAQVEKRVITDLHTNDMVKTDALLADPSGRCKSFFSADRWNAYKKDVRVFRGLMNEMRWIDMHRDHGFNGTPVWTLLPYLLTNLAPASSFHIMVVDLLDPAYLIAAALLIWWAFGPRTFAISMVVLGTNFGNRFYWTGGSLLRYDWLFYLLASICLLKKERFALAGAAFAYTTLLRLFPGLAVAGPVMGAAAYFALHKKLDPRFLKWCMGGALATALLIGSSFAFLGGLPSWKNFVHNTVKHAATPLTNHMGLRTALSWRPTTIGNVMYERFAIDPWGAWKQARLENFNQAKPLFYAILAAACALMFFALRNAGPDPWVALAMGTGFIVLGAELTCYYYCFLMGLALLHEKKREVGLLLSVMCAATIVLEWGPFQGMSRALDEYYVTQSVVTAAACFGVWWLFTKRGNQASLPEETPLARPLKTRGSLST